MVGWVLLLPHILHMVRDPQCHRFVHTDEPLMWEVGGTARVGGTRFFSHTVFTLLLDDRNV